LVYVIAGAYNIRDASNPARLSGGPAWVSALDSAYDIEATAPKGFLHDGLAANLRTEKERLMVQSLLIDRFKLAIHRETKEMPVYALVVGKGGPKLQKSDIQEKDCPADPLIPISSADGSVTCHQFSGGQGRGIHGSAVDLSDLAGYMESWTDKPLLDRTGVKGLYRIDTEPWLSMRLASSSPAPGAKQDGVDIADLATIYTIFERLGLRMVPQKGKVDVYVIDHIEKPSAN
jgi:uncharacterized protein (TIGR03435 family)